MAGPLVRTYKAGSIIYFDGDMGDEVYVLKTGKVILTYLSLDQKEDVKEDVMKGEFFGVKSALGHYPREETAQVLADSNILVMKVPQFEALVKNNPRIILQMLKSFSGQLRKVHRKVRETLGVDSVQETSVELLQVAEHYYKANELDHALYAYKAYLNYYPQATLAERAKQMSMNIQKGQPFPVHLPSLEEEMAKAGGGSKNQSEMPLSADQINSMNAPAQPKPAPVASEPQVEKKSSENLPSTIYYEGVNQYSQGNYDQAIANFDKVLAIKRFPNPSDAQFIEKALFDKGRATVKKGNLSEALNLYSGFVKKYPRSDNLKKALLTIAEIYEKRKEIPRAKSLYAKVASMPPADKDSANAAEKLKKMK